jgi:hypothetical protein
MAAPLLKKSFKGNVPFFPLPPSSLLFLCLILASGLRSPQNFAINFAYPAANFLPRCFENNPLRLTGQANQTSPGTTNRQYMAAPLLFTPGRSVKFHHPIPTRHLKVPAFSRAQTIFLPYPFP